MFNIFRKKTAKQKLQLQYNQLMVETHRLSHVYRRLGDPKIQEADTIRQLLEKMD